MLPAVVDHVTAWLWLFVPTTVATNCWLPDALVGFRLTPVTVEITVAAAIVTVAVPLFVRSCVLVAVIVIVCTKLVCAGAVNNPLASMLPAEAVHVTTWLGLFMPTTVAVNCCEPVAVPGVTDTIVTVEAGAGAPLVPASPSGKPPIGAKPSI